ncbi:MAG TPA: septal ring lytic transglycosylase RlpA family protein [Thermoanaerobaculia bacterium]|jgi:rare lipoprotein A|nr:septal ring lytic transglycosylase RlpA family protein [Thermoanaerobaculia bacterium]
MEETFSPVASQLLGDALPSRLVWERSGRRFAVRMLGAATLAVLAVAAWPRLRAERSVSPVATAPAVSSPLVRGAVRGAHATAAVARVVRDVAVAEARSQVIVPLREIDAWSRRRLDTGEASYYAPGFEGRSTASGELYRAAKYTAAHRSLPFGTLLRVTNVRNGRSVVVRVNDRGPFHPRRIVDLSRAAAAELGLVRRGRGQVRIDVLERLDASRSGA